MEKSCTNCGKPVGLHGAKGYCNTCYARYRRNGAPILRTPKAEGNCANCGEIIGYHGAKGYCPPCYQSWRKYGDPNIKKYGRLGPTCSECSEPPIAKGYCTTHYQRWNHHGDPGIVLPGGREGSRKYTLNHGYFDDIATQGQAYWLGFITADGGIIRSGRTFSLRMMLAERDAAHVQLLADALGSDKPPRTDNRHLTSISFDSWRLVESLGRLGVTPRKSATVEPWNGPADLMPHYWRGLFDGDGSICQSRGSWRLSICGSKPCVLGFAAWGSWACGSKARLRQHQRTPTCWYWTVGGNRMARRLAEALYDGATVTLPRKQERAERLMASR